MKKYNILTAFVDSEDENKFRFAAIKGTDESIVYNFENCVFKESNDTTEFVADLILLKQSNGELVHLEDDDPRVIELTEDSNEILKQFVDDLMIRMTSDIEYVDS